MRRTIYGFVLTILLLLALVSPVAAQPRTPEQAVMLTNNSLGTGYLPGNKAGSFAYYKFPYPGGGTPVTVHASFLPGDPVYRSAFGFTVYGVNGYELGEGSPTSAPATYELVVKDPIATTALIVVHNYDWRQGASYRAWVSGLPEGAAAATPAPTRAPAPQPTPRPSANVSGSGSKESPFALSAGLTVEDSLSGDRGGAFRYATLSAPAGEVVRLTLRITPDFPGAEQSVGMTVYGPRGVVAKGARSETAGLRVAEFVAGNADSYLVQVYNYAPGQTIDYQLTYSQ